MKSTRQEAILELVRHHRIETQEELVSLLTDVGISVTQATVSRDIRQLKLTKVSDGYGHMYYAAPKQDDQKNTGKYERVLREAFVSAEQAGNLLVIRTVSGMAMAAAAALDDMEWEEIVGCIAGDNTIMAAARTPEDVTMIEARLKGIIY